MTVRQRLASLGTELGEFNQGNFRGNYSSIEGAQLTGGYCAGVCLDWARRVLQSATTRDPSYLNYSSPKNATVVFAVTGETRQHQTLRRMATAYKGQGASYVTTTRKSELVPRLTALLNEPESDWNINDQDVTGIPIPNDVAKAIMGLITINPNPLNLQREPAGVVPRQRLQSWLTHISNMADPQHRRLADGGREWAQYTNELDQKFAQIRVTEGRQFSSRGFCNMKVVDSSNQQTYASPGHWRGVLLADGFRDNCCTIIGTGAPGDTGHAVAVHQLGSDYRFFDPNYGVYKYSKQNLKLVLQHLFDAPYFPDDEGLDPGLPVYRRRTAPTQPLDTKPWTQMSYTIFKCGA